MTGSWWEVVFVVAKIVKAAAEVFIAISVILVGWNDLMKF